MSIEDNHRWPKPNHNYVPEYQMSGIPFVITKTLTTPQREGDNNTTLISQTSAENCKFSFDQVTRWLIVSNHHHQDNSHLRIYFNETAFKKALLVDNNGDDKEDKHYYRLDGNGDQTLRLELKCKNIWIYPENANMTVSVIAGLTNVVSNTFPDQTYANGFTGVEDSIEDN